MLLQFERNIYRMICNYSTPWVNWQLILLVLYIDVFTSISKTITMLKVSPFRSTINLSYQIENSLALNWNWLEKGVSQNIVWALHIYMRMYITLTLTYTHTHTQMCHTVQLMAKFMLACAIHVCVVQFY